MCQFKPTDSSVRCAGKSPFFMTKQFACNKTFRQRAALNGYEGVITPQALAMNGPCYYILSHTRFTENKHGRIGLRHLTYLRKDLLYCGTRADDTLNMIWPSLLLFNWKGISSFSLSS